MMIILYKCDADKNTECRKTSCHKKGGPCNKTRNPEFAFKDEKTGKPIIEYVRDEREKSPLFDSRWLK